MEAVRKMASHIVSRRAFVVAMTGACAAFGFTRTAGAAMDPAIAGGIPPVDAGPLFEPTVWFAIDGDGIVTVNIIRAEMGQHVGTALARIVADELEVKWESVRLDYVDTDPKWGLMVTGGSWSVWQSFPYLSQAGAAGRIALIEEGAKLLGVGKDTCIARDGVVIAGHRSISYGEIVRKGNLTRSYSADQLKAMPLKKPAERRLIGAPTKAIDIPGKTNGTARYGLDAEVAGMVYARPKLPPTRNGCTVTSIDDSAAKDVKGYINSVALDDPSGTVPGWVVVYADSFTAANHAADKVKVVWATGEAAKVSEKDILDHGARLIDDPKGGSLVVADEGVHDAAALAWQVGIHLTFVVSGVMLALMDFISSLSGGHGGGKP